jgi:hypothetical protein
VDGIETKKQKNGKPGDPAPFCLAHYQAIEAELKRRPAVRLVIIDPAGAYIGRSGIDDHKDTELRSLLGPLSELAARCSTTILLVKHFSKAANVKAAHRVTGSVGYINTVRAAFALVPDPDDAERKLFLPLKFNIARKPPGQAFRLQSLDVVDREEVLKKFTGLADEDREQMAEQLFRVHWEGEVAADVDAILAQASKQERGPNKVEKCAEWLRGFLKDYAYPSDEILGAAKKEGFTFDNVKEAKKQLKADGLHSSNRGKFGGTWWSGFGEPDSWKLRPTTPHYPHTPEYPHNPHNGQADEPIVGKEGNVGSEGSEGSGGDGAPQYDAAETTVTFRGSCSGRLVLRCRDDDTRGPFEGQKPRPGLAGTWFPTRAGWRQATRHPRGAPHGSRDRCTQKAQVLCPGDPETKRQQRQNGRNSGGGFSRTETCPAHL